MAILLENNLRFDFRLNIVAHFLIRHFPFDDDRLRRQPFRVPV
jgi:hypothetical protein